MFAALARLEELLRAQGMTTAEIQAALSTQQGMATTAAAAVQAAAASQAAAAQAAATQAAGQVQAANTQAATEQVRILNEVVLPAVSSVFEDMAKKTQDPQWILSEMEKAIDARDKDRVVELNKMGATLPEDVRRGMSNYLVGKYGVERLIEVGLGAELNPLWEIVKALGVAGLVTAGVVTAGYAGGIIGGTAAAGATTTAAAATTATATSVGAAQAACCATSAAAMGSQVVHGFSEAIGPIAMKAFYATIVAGAITAAWYGVTTAITERVRGWVDEAGRAKGVRPEGAFERASAMAFTALTVTQTVMAVTHTAEIAAYTKKLGLDDQAMNLISMAGIVGLAHTFYSTVWENLIRIPLRYDMAARMTPEVLSLGDACDAWAMGFLDDDEFKKHLRYHGLPEIYDRYWFEKADKDLSVGEIVEARGREKIDDREMERALKIAGADLQWVPVWKALGKRPVSPFLVRLIADSEAFDEDILREMMIDAQYKPEHAEFMIYAFKLAVMKSYRSGLISSLIKNYREGYIPREEMMTKLGQLGIRPDLTELIAAQADYEYHFDYVSDVLTAAKTAFAKDLLTEDELRGIMSEWIVIPEKVDALLAKEVFKKIPKPKAPKPEV